MFLARSNLSSALRPLSYRVVSGSLVSGTRRPTTTSGQECKTRFWGKQTARDTKGLSERKGVPMPDARRERKGKGRKGKDGVREWAVSVSVSVNVLRERLLACASSRSLAGADQPTSRPASWLTTVGLLLFCSVRRLEPVRVEPRDQLVVYL